MFNSFNTLVYFSCFKDNCFENITGIIIDNIFIKTTIKANLKLVKNKPMVQITIKNKSLIINNKF